MKTTILICCIPFICLAEEPLNPKIDYAGFVKMSQTLAPIRAAHRVSEEQFIEMAAAPRTVILDARSKDRYENIHIKGALHLALTDFTEAALRALVPDLETPILIYCNNNFNNEPVNFPSKCLTVSLNIQTFINLHAYGYKNVYELAPLLDVKTTKIRFAGTSVK